MATPLKLNEETHRICADYALTLNSRLLKQTIVMVEVEDILNSLPSPKMLSKVDLKHYYLHIFLDTISNTTIFLVTLDHKVEIQRLIFRFGPIKRNRVTIIFCF